MRNLKRALSLTLASVMLLGMMVIGTSAASYPDVDENDNVEAIEVLQTVGVMQGDDKGNFDPDRSVSRNEMAIIMAKLLNLDYNYYSESCPFWDVPDYAKPYVGACYANGIVSGYNANTYGGADTVTAVQAASMMMRALGYFQYDSDYKDGFVIATVRQASKIGLFADINAGQDTPLTRNQVAQLALNTLETAIVDAKDNTLNISGESGGMSMSVSGGQVDYIVRTSSEDFAKAINNTDKGDTTTTGRTGFTVELGEQLYDGDLKKGRTTDDFGRPSDQWTYKYSKIGTYADTPDYTYTTSISGSTPADKVRNMGLKDYKWANSSYTTTVDGKEVENATASYVENGVTVRMGKTNAKALEELADEIAADGVLIEVFMDDDRTDTIEKVTVIRTQMMQVNVVGSSEVSLKKLDTDRFESDGVAMGKVDGFLTVKNVKEDEDGYEVLKSLKADDYVLIVPVHNGSQYVVSQAIVPESITGTLETIYTKSDNTKVAGIGVDGTKYNMSYSWTAEDDELRVNTKLSSKVDCQVYLDTYGNAIYVKDVKAHNSAIIIDYIYSALEGGKIVKYAQGWDASGNELTLNLGTSPANLESVEANMQGKVYEYTTATKNDADYELILPKKAWDGKSIVYDPTADASVSYGMSGIVVEDGGKSLPFASNVKFIFITTEDNKIGTDVTGITVKTGVSEVKDPASLTYILNKDMNKVVAVVVPNDNDAGNTTNLLYLEKITRYSVGKNGKEVAFGTVWINGEKTENVEFSKRYDKTDDVDKFYTYSESNGVFTLSKYEKTDKATSVATKQVLTGNDFGTDSWFKGGADQLNGVDATVIDLYSDDNLEIVSVKGMKDAIKNEEINNKTGKPVQNFKVSYIYNGDSGDSGYNTVQYVFVTMADAKSGTTPPPAGTYNVNVYVNETKDDALSLTGVKDGEHTITYTVLAGATATYKIGKDGTETAVPANGEIKVTVAGASVDVYITSTVDETVKTLTTANGFPITYKLIKVGNKTYMDATITYPEWVGNTAGTTVNGKVGVYVGSAEVSGGTKALNFTRTAGTEATGSATVDLGIEVDPATMTIKEDSSNAYVASYVKVQLAGTDTEKLVSTYTKELQTGSSRNITVTLSTSTADATVDSNVKYTVKNGTAAVGAETAVTGTSSSAFTISVTPNSNGFIVVTLTGLDKLTQSYTVTPLTAKKLNGGDNGSGLTINGGTGLADGATITLAGTPASGSTGTTVIQATVTAAALSTASPANYGVVVKVALEDGTVVGEQIVTGTSATTIGTLPLTKNYDLTKVTITVTQIPKLAVVGAPTINGNTYTFTFNRAIKLADSFAAATNVTCNNASTTTCLSATVDPTDNTKLVVVLDKPVEATKKITLVGTLIQDAAYSGNTNTAGDIYTAPAS